MLTSRILFRNLLLFFGSQLTLEYGSVLREQASREPELKETSTETLFFLPAFPIWVMAPPSLCHPRQKTGCHRILSLHSMPPTKHTATMKPNILSFLPLKYLLFLSRASFTGIQPVYLHRSSLSARLHTWGLMLCTYLEILNNVFFTFLLCKSSSVGQWSMCQGARSLSSCMIPPPAISTGWVWDCSLLCLLVSCLPSLNLPTQDQMGQTQAVAAVPVPD